MKSLAVVLLLAACSSKPAMTTPEPKRTPDPTQPGPPAPIPGPNDLPPPIDAAQGDATGSGTAGGPPLGQPCGAEDDKCGEGQCVTYYGIAGPKGPAFKSCEIKCDGTPCPTGRKCVTIADGPGRVCR